MRIKEVQFEKLFSLEKYNNERIGFTAEIGENESADLVVGELHFKILDIEECLDVHRRILSNLDYASQRFAEKQSSINQMESEIALKKVKIEEITKLLEEGRLDADERLRHACDRESYKDMQKRLTEYHAELEQLDIQVKQLTQSKQQLRERIQKGNFSLEGIQIPYISRRYY